MSRVGNQTSCPLKRKREKEEAKKTKQEKEEIGWIIIKWEKDGQMKRNKRMLGMKNCIHWWQNNVHSRIQNHFSYEYCCSLDSVFAKIKRFKTQFISFKHDVDNITLFLTKECPISTGNPPNWWNVRIWICDINDNRLGDKQSYSR